MNVELLHCQYSSKPLEYWDYPELKAHFWRMYLADQEGAAIVHRGTEIPLQPGQWLVIPPETSFRSQLTRPIRKLYAHFTMIDFERDIVAQPVVVATDTYESMLANRFRDQSGSDAQAGQLTMLALVGLVLRRIPPDRWVVQRRHPLVTRVREHLEHITRHPCTVEGMADLIGLSPRQWQRLCRQETGLSPSQYAMSVRLATVANRLVHSDVSLDQLAADHGFCDRYHLSRAFKAQFDESPAAYRAQRSSERS